MTDLSEMWKPDAMKETIENSKGGKKALNSSDRYGDRGIDKCAFVLIKKLNLYLYLK